MTTANLPRAGAAARQVPPDVHMAVSGGYANINPATGLATDYLNHFNEAIMLLEMAASWPEAIADFLAWQPRSYGEHFALSRFADRAAAITAYDVAEPHTRRHLDALADAMTAVLMTAHAVLRTNPPQQTVAAVAGRALASLKPLVARAGAIINGSADADDDVISPQHIVDALMER